MAFSIIRLKTIGREKLRIISSQNISNHKHYDQKILACKKTFLNKQEKRLSFHLFFHKIPMYYNASSKINK